MSDRSPQNDALVPSPAWFAPPRPATAAPEPLFLLVMTLLAAALRLHGLMHQSLWVDELLTWQTIRPGVGLEFVEQIRDTIQGPLYMAVIWPLVRWQDPAMMMRLVALVAGIATIPAFGVLAARTLDRRAARLAVLLLVLNPFHVWYCQEGRGYAFLILFSVLAGICYLRMRANPGRRALIPVALVLAGCILSNMSGLFLWAAMGLTLIVIDMPAQRRPRLLWLAALAAALVVVLPWILQATGIWAVDRIVPGSGTGVALRGETTFAPLALPYTMFTFGYGYSLGPSLRDWHAVDRTAILRSAWPILAAGGLPLALALLTSLWRIDRRRLRLMIWILVPLAVLVVLAVRNIKPWNPRYVAVVFPFVVLLAADGMARWRRSVGLALSVVLVGLTLYSLGAYHLDDRYAKADVRGAAAIVARSPRAGDPVLAPSVTPVYKFYRADGGALLDAYGRPPLRDAGAADDFIREKLDGHDACWVVLAREWVFDPRGLLPRSLVKHGHLRLEATLPGVRLLHWQREATATREQGAGR